MAFVLKNKKTPGWATSFDWQLTAFKIPQPKREYRFHPVRRWRFDFAWPEIFLAVEIDGGVWSGGRHTRGAGFIGDVEKLNEAQLAGWVVLRFVPQQVRSGAAIKKISEAMTRLADRLFAG